MNFVILNDYPYYEIYEDGTIISIERKCKDGKNMKRKRLCPCRQKSGYSTVKLLHKDGYFKKFYLHRLVYMAFRGDITGQEVDHIDGNRSNSVLSNLKLCDHTTNCRNPRSLERYKKANTLSAGKFDRDKMMAAKSKDYYQKLVRTYKRLVKEHGYCGIWMLMQQGHCGYPRAKRIITEMKGENEEIN
jgi:hypothetical protein